MLEILPGTRLQLDATRSGQVVDTTVGLGKLTLLYSQARSIPGLASALTGLSSGEDFDVGLAPEQAFGPRSASMIQTLERARFPSEASLFVGAQMLVQTERPKGYATMYVTAIDGDVVTVDLHHPLAGEGLRLMGRLMAVRPATPEELTQGLAPRLEPD